MNPTISPIERLSYQEICPDCETLRWGVKKKRKGNRERVERGEQEVEEQRGERGKKGIRGGSREKE